jgi:hypothetical protein
MITILRKNWYILFEQNTFITNFIQIIPIPLSPYSLRMNWIKLKLDEWSTLTKTSGKFLAPHLRSFPPETIPRRMYWNSRLWIFSLKIVLLRYYITPILTAFRKSCLDKKCPLQFCRIFSMKQRKWKIVFKSFLLNLNLL